MTHDPHKDLDFTYNFLNSPKEVSKNGADRLKTVYDATGRKWMMTSTVVDDSGNPTVSTTETKE